MARQLVAIIFFAVVVLAKRSPVYIDDTTGTFVKDGRPFRYISGSFHYWRTPPEYWKDRLKKMVSAGLNAVQTYIPWHLHEPYPGEYRFDDELNVFRFLSTANETGLLVIIRPGPYIDNLNEFGGLPAWLLWDNDDDIRSYGRSYREYLKRDRSVDNAASKTPYLPLRSSDRRYLRAVFAWFDFLFPKLAPYSYVNGGPIFASQVENELGSYRPLSSETYLARLIVRFRKHFGDDVVLFTTDGASGWFLKYLRTPRLIFPTVDFGVQKDKSGVEASFASQKSALRRLGFGAGPLVNSEYYPGWHDYWGRRYISVDGAASAKTLADILSLNASVNIFMFVGGTIYGFHGGTTIGDGGFYYTATTTWDYDAPISEAGDPTKKLYLIRDVLKKYIPGPLPPVPVAMDKSDCAVSLTGRFRQNASVLVQNFLAPSHFLPLRRALPVLCPRSRIFHSAYPLTFEDMRQDYGYVLYRATASFSALGNFTAMGLRDRGLVYVNERYVGEINRNGNTTIVDVGVKAGDVVELLVENLGRKDYGVMVADEVYKGILSNVSIGSRILTNWTAFSLPLNDTEKLLFSEGWREVDGTMKNLYRSFEPLGFYSFHFSMKYGVDHRSGRVCSRGDAFFLMGNFKKGVLFLNGRNIGRYWTEAGPQQTLFIANPYLKFSPVDSSKNDENVALIFETEGSIDNPIIPLMKIPILDGPWKPPNVT